MTSRPPTDDLAGIARSVAADWGVRLGSPFTSSPGTYVAPAGDSAVLKVRAASDWESDHEPQALLGWAGRGAVRLLRHDRTRRAVLVERAQPGEDLSTVPATRAIEIAATVAQLLWLPAERDFPSIHSFIPAWLDEVAADAEVRTLYDKLTRPPTTLVHGDLHHHNILRHGDSWVAIDPKPMAGEPEFDIAPLLWNPIGHVPTQSSVEHCLDVFSSAGLDRWRMHAWAIVRATYLSCFQAMPGIRAARV
jgi:streptomycin 6-kinase